MLSHRHVAARGGGQRAGHNTARAHLQEDLLQQSLAGWSWRGGAHPEPLLKSQANFSTKTSTALLTLLPFAHLPRTRAAAAHGAFCLMLPAPGTRLRNALPRPSHVRAAQGGLEGGPAPLLTSPNTKSPLHPTTRPPNRPTSTNRRPPNRLTHGCNGLRLGCSSTGLRAFGSAPSCGRRGPTPPAAPPPVCLLRIFGRIQKSLRSRWGLGPCNQSIASGFGAAEIKSVFFAVFDVFRCPARALARVEAALARRIDHTGFARRLWSVRAVKTINGSRWRVP